MSDDQFQFPDDPNDFKEQSPPADNSYAYADQFPQPNKSNNTQTIIIGIIVGIAFICFCALAVGGGLLYAVRNQEMNASIRVNAPEQLRTGQSGTITVVITNPTNQAQELDSIDIGLDYLSGVSITGSNPAYVDDFSLEPLLDQHSYSFYKSIPAEGSLTVVFQIKGTQSGSYSGIFDVCIDSGSNCETHTVSTNVGN